MDTPAFAVPRDFFCEHAASRSRVLVRLSRAGRHDGVQTVLTCTDPDLAQQVAVLLRQAVYGGRGPAVEAEAERLAARLPAPVAASLRQAAQWVFAGTWPVPAHAHRPIPADDPDDDEALSPAALDAMTRTPADAKLGDLTGKVVRIVRLVELHVHDPERLRSAATAAGWLPGNAEDLPDDDAHDLLGAAMQLTDDVPTVPGTDLVTLTSHGEMLSVEAQDELAGWSTGAVAVNFGAGWRSRNHPHPDAGDNEPAFAALFPLDGDDDTWLLTPRTAAALYTALSMLADEAYDDVEEHGDEPIVAHDESGLVRLRPSAPDLLVPQRRLATAGGPRSRRPM